MRVRVRGVRAQNLCVECKRMECNMSCVHIQYREKVLLWCTFQNLRILLELAMHSITHHHI